MQPFCLETPLSGDNTFIYSYFAEFIIKTFLKKLKQSVYHNRSVAILQKSCFKLQSAHGGDFFRTSICTYSHFVSRMWIFFLSYVTTEQLFIRLCADKVSLKEVFFFLLTELLSRCDQAWRVSHFLARSSRCVVSLFC